MCSRVKESKYKFEPGTKLRDSFSIVYQKKKKKKSLKTKELCKTCKNDDRKKFNFSSIRLNRIVTRIFPSKSTIYLMITHNACIYACAVIIF